MQSNKSHLIYLTPHSAHQLLIFMNGWRKRNNTLLCSVQNWLLNNSTDGFSQMSDRWRANLYILIKFSSKWKLLQSFFILFSDSFTFYSYLTSFELYKRVVECNFFPSPSRTIQILRFNLFWLEKQFHIL